MAVAGALLMIASEFATLRSVKVLTASCSDLAEPSLRGSCVTHGGEEHSYALVLLGVVMFQPRGILGLIVSDRERIGSYGLRRRKD